MLQKKFVDIVQLIKQARTKAIKSVNSELINLYWNIENILAKGVKVQNGMNPL